MAGSPRSDQALAQEEEQHQEGQGNSAAIDGIPNALEPARSLASGALSRTRSRLNRGMPGHQVASIRAAMQGLSADPTLPSAESVLK